MHAVKVMRTHELVPLLRFAGRCLHVIRTKSRCRDMPRVVDPCQRQRVRLWKMNDSTNTPQATRHMKTAGAACHTAERQAERTSGSPNEEYEPPLRP